jgi:hypothetical protein
MRSLICSNAVYRKKRSRLCCLCGPRRVKTYSLSSQFNHLPVLNAKTIKCQSIDTTRLLRLIDQSNRVFSSSLALPYYYDRGCRCHALSVAEDWEYGVGLQGDGANMWSFHPETVHSAGSSLFGRPGINKGEAIRPNRTHPPLRCAEPC